MNALSSALILFSTLLLLGGCGSSSDGEDAHTNPCAQSSTPIYGVQHSDTNSCFLTESKTVIGCSGDGRGSSGDSAGSSESSLCARRRADGAEFWLVGAEDFLLNQAAFEACGATAQGSLDNPPCFAAACEQSPLSTCTEAETKQHFACGEALSEWDEQCCARTGCEEDTDCTAGERCTPLQRPTGQNAQASPTGDGCDFVQTSDSVEVKVCIPQP